MRPGALLLALAGLVCGCGGEPAPTFEELARAHLDPELVNGGWYQKEGELAFLTIGTAENGGLNVVLTTEGTEERALGRVREGILFVDPPLAGIRRFFPCRLRGSEVLLPESGCWLDRSESPRPHGSYFSRLDELDAYLPGPDDENRPAPWREVYGTGN